ncbi:HK97-gp10 family putative phage morphogenesis protein [Laribacter hongkongensis]|uniref:HK97-gp10 family putative phage morphogenesis protein n=1 Tax=Laribacter hongkongensis TaxID=168471 RepID=UPI001EFDF62B|nr:HK97-gp10 family putative phage morphogenesis protein [Laribacter hongkongensis]MCG9076936.1 HK97 gp10 family phage protein [Laribacter hongkongensis]
MSTVRISFDSDALKARVAQFGQDLQDKCARPAAHQAALVLYDEMRERVPVDQGDLKDSIYRWHDAARSVNGRHIYLVGPRKRKAPHWHLIEYGWTQYFRVRQLPDGRWVTLVRPEARGKKPPGTRAPLAVKQAYYQPLDTPRKHPARPYIRTAYDARIKQALQRGKDRFAERVREVLNGQP